MKRLLILPALALGILSSAPSYADIVETDRGLIGAYENDPERYYFEATGYYPGPPSASGCRITIFCESLYIWHVDYNDDVSSQPECKQAALDLYYSEWVPIIGDDPEVCAVGS